MNLAIDIGNSLAKLAVIENGQVVDFLKTDRPDAAFVAGVLDANPAIDAAIAVADDGWEFDHWSASIGFVDQQESIMFTVPGDADANGVFLTAHFRKVEEEEPDPTASPTPSPSPSPTPVPGSSSSTASSGGSSSTPASSSSTSNSTPPAPTQCPHSSTSTSRVEPTCGAAGSETVTCTACGTVISTTTLPATGAHSFSNGVCTVCGATDPNYVAPSSSQANAANSGNGTEGGGETVPSTVPAE